MDHDMDHEELTAHERSYLAGYLAHEPQPRPEVQVDTWAAITARIQQHNVAISPQRSRRAAIWRQPTTWAVGLTAVAASLLLGWQLNLWRHNTRAGSNPSTTPGEAVYHTNPGQTLHRTTERPHRTPQSAGAPIPEANTSLSEPQTIEPQTIEPQVVRPQSQSVQQPQPGRSPTSRTAPSEPAASNALAPRPRPRRRSAPPSNLTAPELQQFEKARRLALHGDPTQALHLLRQHQRQYPNSLLAEERAVAEAQALCRKGDVKEARRHAERFIRRHSTSHLVRKMRHVCLAESPAQ